MKRIIVRVLTWPVRSLWRILIIGWLTGLGVVGAASSALADQGPIVGPDLAHGAAQTVFEQAPWYGYGLPVFVETPTLGTVEQVMWGALNLIAMLLDMISAVLVRGALAGMQWMLNLTLYRDNSAEIDTATHGVASAVFWPLIGCTVAVAGFTMYAKARRDGNGSILGEAVKVTLLGVLAIAFVMAPSKIVGPLDDARTAASNAIMTGYSSDHLATGGSAAGFPSVPVQATPDGASRGLADGLWNTFVLTPWCYTAWGGLDTCKAWGQEFINNTPKWVAVDQQIVGTDQLNDATSAAATAATVAAVGVVSATPPASTDFCVTKFGPACDSVRGITLSRIGSAMVAALVAIPMALLLILLTVFGLLAAIGVLVLAMMAPLFLVGWIIPGMPRTIGLKWFQALLGCMIQSGLIAALLGVVMVLGAILQSMVPTYGFWMVGLLNLAVLIMAVRVRSMFENLIGLSHPAASGLMSSYVAMKALGVIGRHAKGVTRTAGKATGLAGRGGVATVGAGVNQLTDRNSATSRAARSTAGRAASLRQHFAVPAPLPTATGGIATPYRTPHPAPVPQPAVPGAPTRSALSAPQSRRALPGGYNIPGRTVDALPTPSTPGRASTPARLARQRRRQDAVTMDTTPDARLRVDQPRGTGGLRPSHRRASPPPRTELPYRKPRKDPAPAIRRTGKASSW